MTALTTKQIAHLRGLGQRTQESTQQIQRKIETLQGGAQQAAKRK